MGEPQQDRAEASSVSGLTKDGIVVGAGDAGRPDGYVQALSRGLAVLRAFDVEAPELTISDVAQRTGMTKAAARRFLMTLVQLGYASFNGRSYSLRPKVLEIGGAYLSSLRLPDLAQPRLEELAATVRETSSLTVLDGSDVVYVARVQGHRIITVSIEVGTRFPALATSTGRVLLSGWSPDRLRDLIESTPPQPLSPRSVTGHQDLLEEVRAARDRGWALTDREVEEGLRSIAVPIHDLNGAVTAAVNVSAHISRASIETLTRQVLPVLQQAARSIEADIAADARLGDGVAVC